MATNRTLFAAASALLFVGVLGAGAALAHGGRTRDDRMESREFNDMMSAHPEMTAKYMKSDDASTCEADVLDKAGGLFGHFFINAACQ